MSVSSCSAEYHMTSTVMPSVIQPNAIPLRVILANVVAPFSLVDLAS